MTVKTKFAPVLACVALAFSLLPTAPAGASFWQSCRITAEVTTVGSVMDHPELGLHITAADTMGGSHASCDDMVGNDVTGIITKTPEDITFAPGQSVVLDYIYYNAMGPNGVIDDLRWEYVSTGE